MCGRFANGLTYEAFADAIDPLLPQTPRAEKQARDYYPSYNVAPGTRYPIVHVDRQAGRDQLVVETMRWGVPMEHGAQTDRTEGHLVINARDETIFQSRSLWHKLLPTHRCVVFCQGYFEWQKVPGAGETAEKRIPHFVGMEQSGQGRETAGGATKQLMPMAGLWTEVPSDGDEPDRVFTIATTHPNKQLTFLHDRMPVILPTSEAITAWLGLGEVGEVVQLLRPYPAPLDCYVVPKEVGRVGRSDKSYIIPVSQRKDGLPALFAKQEKDTASAKEPAKDKAGASLNQESDSTSKPSIKTEHVDTTRDSGDATTKPSKAAPLTPPKKPAEASAGLAPRTPPRKKAKTSASPKRTPRLESLWNTNGDASRSARNAAEEP